MLEKFINYLLNNNLSRKSLKNYKSDLNHFYAWFTLELKKIGVFANELQDILPFLDAGTAEKFKDHLVAANTPEKTVNRRLSTLRQFSKFLQINDLIALDFMESIQNVSKEIAKKVNFKAESLASDYAQHLQSAGVSKNTLKNYMSDVRHFLNWLEANHV